MKRRRSSQRKLIKTQFEDLSNELIYEIFDYFDYIFIYEIFGKLNQRFHSLFLHSLLPIKINFPLTFKFLYQYRCQNLILPNIQRIISLNISKYFLDYFSIHLFSSLQSLIISQISSEQILIIINHLIILPKLSSLTIHTYNYFHDENSFYLSIFHLTKLIFCKLNFPSSGERVPLPFAIHHYSTLERLIINGHCRLDQLISILSYTPKLQHLSCQYLYGTECIENNNISIKLISIYLILYQISFNELKLFLSKISFNLKKLRIQKSNDENYFYAQQWKELIINFMPNLNIFDFHYSNLINENFNQKLIEEFSTNFWLEKNWFFDYYYYKIENVHYLNFFTIYPYQYYHFILYEQIYAHQTRLNQMNYARHLTIEDHIILKNYSIKFPNVKKLTLKDNISLIKDLNLIISLKQITDLEIKTNEFSIEILSYFPNLQSLTISNLFSFSSKYIQLFRKNNKIQKLIIDDDECNLKQIRSLVHLFSHLQILEISINENQYKDILQFLLNKSSNLFSLFLININTKLIEKIDILLKNYNYTIERIHGGLYIWL